MIEIPGKERLTKRVHTSYNKKEYAIIKEFAAGEYMKPATFVKKCSLWYCEYKKIEQQMKHK